MQRQRAAHLPLCQHKLRQRYYLLFSGSMRSLLQTRSVLRADISTSSVSPVVAVAPYGRSPVSAAQYCYADLRLWAWYLPLPLVSSLLLYLFEHRALRFLATFVTGVVARAVTRLAVLLRFPLPATPRCGVFHVVPWRTVFSSLKKRCCCYLAAFASFRRREH
jgi:hypothetical protein